MNRGGSGLTRGSMVAGATVGEEVLGDTTAATEVEGEDVAENIVDDIDGGAGEGCATVAEEGWAVASEDVVEGGTAVVPFTSCLMFLLVFLADPVAAVAVLFEFGAAAAMLVAFLVSLASLYFFLHSKHVRRGFIVPFLMFSLKR